MATFRERTFTRNTGHDEFLLKWNSRGCFRRNSSANSVSGWQYVSGDHPPRVGRLCLGSWARWTAGGGTGRAARRPRPWWRRATAGRTAAPTAAWASWPRGSAPAPALGCPFSPRSWPWRPSGERPVVDAVPGTRKLWPRSRRQAVSRSRRSDRTTVIYHQWLIK